VIVCVLHIAFSFFIGLSLSVKKHCLQKKTTIVSFVAHKSLKSPSRSRSLGVFVALTKCLGNLEITECNAMAMDGSQFEMNGLFCYSVHFVLRMYAFAVSALAPHQTA